MAYLNWRFGGYSRYEQFCTMGDSYLETQYNQLWMLVQNRRDHRADGWIFPILFNTMHGIECYLKGFGGQLEYLEKVVKGVPIEDIEFKNPWGHELLPLSVGVIKQLDDLYQLTKDERFKEATEAIEFIKSFIELLVSKSDYVAVFRYPFDTKSEELFYNKSLENETIHLELYFIWFTKVHDTLKSLNYFFDDLSERYIYNIGE